MKAVYLHLEGEVLKDWSGFDVPGLALARGSATSNALAVFGSGLPAGASMTAHIPVCVS